jgi:hypothetical protein
MNLKTAAPLRIGVWFQENHAPFGGPTLVLLGTLCGFYQYAESHGFEIIVLLNEVGDVNWSIGPLPNMESKLLKMPKIWYGPLLTSHGDAESDFKENILWQNARNVLFPSTWFCKWICSGLPYNDPSKAEDRNFAVWPSGVDIDFFCPSKYTEKTQDYFIYFKSQNAHELSKVLYYIFSNWFGMKGTVLTYYNYDPAMLLHAARNSKFCIMLGIPETQGLAALEIMATGCPLFVCDVNVYRGTKKSITCASSVNDFDSSCGMKSNIEKLEIDFPVFIQNLESYNPRSFVLSNYSFKAAAGRLLDLITRESHQAQNDKKENDCVEEQAKRSRATTGGC